MHPFYLFSHFIAYFSSKLTYNRCKELVVSELYYKQKITLQIRKDLKGYL